MQAVTATFQQQNISDGRVAWSAVAQGALSWLTRIFGCWHQEMSRPFTLQAESYRVCLECGARRRFNAEAWEMTGPYYYEAAAPAAELYANLSHEAASAVTVRRKARPALRAAA